MSVNHNGDSPLSSHNSNNYYHSRARKKSLQINKYKSLWSSISPEVSLTKARKIKFLNGALLHFHQHLVIYLSKLEDVLQKKKKDIDLSFKQKTFTSFCISNNIHMLLLFSCSVVSDSLVTPQIVAHQAPLSMEFSRQEYISKLNKTLDLTRD